MTQISRIRERLALGEVTSTEIDGLLIRMEELELALEAIVSWHESDDPVDYAEANMAAIARQALQEEEE